MNRIAVIGRPGSGKSYFSTQLAKKTGLPLIHLDRIYHDLATKLEGEELSQTMRTEIKEIVDQKRWLTDGNYGSSLDIRLPAADTIIYFEYPMWLVLYRLAKRRLMYVNRKREDMPDDWKERFNPRFYRSHVFGYKKSKWYPDMMKLLNELSHDKQVVVLHSPKEARQFLNSI